MRSRASISSRRRRRRPLRQASRSPPSAREAVGASRRRSSPCCRRAGMCSRSHADFLPAAPKGALVIDSSTIDVDSAKRAHEAGARGGRADPRRAGVAAGSAARPPARSPSCAAARAEAFAKAKPILETMGKRIVHCGGAGAGQAAKICNNMILGATMIVTCEAFALAEKLGLVGAGAVRRRLDRVGPVVVAHELLPGSRPCAGFARQPRLQARLCREPDAQGPASSPRRRRRASAPRLRSGPRPRSFTPCLSPPAMAATTSPA